MTLYRDHFQHLKERQNWYLFDRLSANGLLSEYFVIQNAMIYLFQKTGN